MILLNLYSHVTVGDLKMNKNVGPMTFFFFLLPVLFLGFSACTPCSLLFLFFQIDKQVDGGELPQNDFTDHEAFPCRCTQVAGARTWVLAHSNACALLGESPFNVPLPTSPKQQILIVIFFYSKRIHQNLSDFSISYFKSV